MPTLIRDIPIAANTATHLLILDDQIKAVRAHMNKKCNVLDEPTHSERDLLEMVSNCFASALDNIALLSK